MPLPAELPLVPTLADMAVLGIRAEALRGVANANKEARLAAAFDWVLSRVSARIKRPLVSLDDADLKEAMCLRAAIQCLKWDRGVRPDAGQDALIKGMTDELAALMEEIRKGEVLHAYTDSTPTVDEKSPRLSRNFKASDEFINAKIGIPWPLGYKPFGWP